MKKLLLTLTIAASSLFANAQRNIDWSTEALLGIDTIYSSASGTPIPLTFVMKNNGTDTVMPGDSLVFQFVLSAGTQIIGAYPSASTLSLKLISTMVLPGDTMHIALPIGFNLKVSTSARVNASIISSVINRPALPFEVAPNNTNNQKTINILWMNEQRWPVGLAEELNKAANSVKVYPNPASDVVNFSIDYNKASTVNVMDITGKLVATTSFHLGNAQLDARSLNAGVYLYQIVDTDGVVVKTGKVTIN